MPLVCVCVCVFVADVCECVFHSGGDLAGPFHAQQPLIIGRARARARRALRISHLAPRLIAASASEDSIQRSAAGKCRHPKRDWECIKLYAYARLSCEWVICARQS